MRLVTSQLRSPVAAPLVFPRGTAEAQEQRRAQAPVLWPRYDPATRSTRFVRIPPSQIPAGWQSVQFHVPMRLATCEEAECPMWLHGWTEVQTPDGGHHTRPGEVTSDEAAAVFGLYGPRELAPQVIHHPAGTVCPGDASLQPPVALVNAGQAGLNPRAHKVPSGVPPLYTVNGRPVLWNEFEDSIGSGLEATRKLREQE